MEKSVPPMLHGLLMFGRLSQVRRPAAAQRTVSGGSGDLQPIDLNQVFHWCHLDLFFLHVREQKGATLPSMLA